MDRIRSIFKTQPDESDIFLTIGTLSLFFGCSLIHPAIGYIVTGCIFLYLAYILANPKHEAPPVTG